MRHVPLLFIPAILALSSCASAPSDLPAACSTWSAQCDVQTSPRDTRVAVLLFDRGVGFGIARPTAAVMGARCRATAVELLAAQGVALDPTQLEVTTGMMDEWTTCRTRAVVPK